MTQSSETPLASPEEVQALAQAMGGDSDAALVQLQAAADQFPGDGRVHFLLGSLLASLRRYDEARAAMQRAVEFAQDFPIARFQAGFLELTSGNAAGAEHYWQGLAALPANHFLRLFSAGLTSMAYDRFEEAIATLSEGIARNQEVLPLNNDMRLLIEEMQRTKPQDPTAEPVTSAAHLLLQEYLNKTKH
jgi:Flp pilus assembly protein TadD